MSIRASAHNFVMTQASVTFKPDKTYEVDLGYEVDSLLAGVGPSEMLPEVYEYLLMQDAVKIQRQISEIKTSFSRTIRIRFDKKNVSPAISFPDEGKNPYEGKVARLLPGARVRFSGSIPKGAETFSFKASAIYGPIDFRILKPDGGIAVQQLMLQGAESAPYPLDLSVIPQPSRFEVIRDYLILGYEHILPKGLDHILFVLGLFLLSARLRPLLLQVTAFTVAHTVTLGLSIYGVISLPSRVAEPLIAVSIAYVAVENILTAELKPWRPAVVFCFGLLHGLGFAGVLAELGLPKGQLLSALLSFNVGVELGQLSVILAAFLAAGRFRRRAWYRSRVTVPASFAIALVAVYWTITRIVG
ncbi:HupE/UreJ family protein [Candidatus Sumerlaeota bacterium]|nr:HupE/UreJ family protein [Candidatus Sumerlaeota bacterium]